MKINQEIDIKSLDDLLICRRNELSPRGVIYSEGLKGYLEYRTKPKHFHVEQPYRNGKRMNIFKWYLYLYDMDEDEISSGDIIVNCWSYLRRFVEAKFSHSSGLDEYALDNLDKLFVGYEYLIPLFNKLSNLHHSLANMMPAPNGFNNCRKCEFRGKGDFKLDNDMPDLFYQRAENDCPFLKEWIDNNMERYSKLLIQCKVRGTL